MTLVKELSMTAYTIITTSIVLQSNYRKPLLCALCIHNPCYVQSYSYNWLFMEFPLIILISLKVKSDTTQFLFVRKRQKAYNLVIFCNKTLFLLQLDTCGNVMHGSHSANTVGQLCRHGLNGHTHDHPLYPKPVVVFLSRSTYITPIYPSNITWLQ